MSKLIRSDRIAAAAALVALALAGAGQASAEGDGQSDPLSYAPPTAFHLPGADLRVLPSQLRAGRHQQITFSVTQTRAVSGRSTVDVTLPRPWLQRAAFDSLAFATVPAAGTGSSGRVRVRRNGRVVRFSFANARRADRGTYTVTDGALPPGTYRGTFAQRSGGFTTSSGSFSVVVLQASAVIPVPPQ